MQHMQSHILSSLTFRVPRNKIVPFGPFCWDVLASALLLLKFIMKLGRSVEIQHSITDLLRKEVITSNTCR
jgi:hypothetical protein